MSAARSADVVKWAVEGITAGTTAAIFLLTTPAPMDLDIPILRLGVTSSEHFVKQRNVI